MLNRTRVALLGIGALALGCDAFPKFQLQLQQEIQREFHITNAMVMVVDSTYMVVAIFDDKHSAFEQTELAAFKEQVAHYAVTHYHRSKLRTLGVMVGRATRRGSDRDPEATLFVPEYHPDGTVRLAMMPPQRERTKAIKKE
ncbi:MAG TPA: hypothetical protein VGJ80_09425 [Gemmatimonadales bacterium]|jgi:hypothetical protein